MQAFTLLLLYIVMKLENAEEDAEEEVDENMDDEMGEDEEVVDISNWFLVVLGRQISSTLLRSSRWQTLYTCPASVR